jgi:phosphorylcholine metabolism protein LicD
MYLPTIIWIKIFEFDPTFYEIYNNVINEFKKFNTLKGSIKHRNKILYRNEKIKEWKQIQSLQSFDQSYLIYQNLIQIIQFKYKLSQSKSIKIHSQIYQRIKTVFPSNFNTTISIFENEIRNSTTLSQLLKLKNYF